VRWPVRYREHAVTTATRPSGQSDSCARSLVGEGIERELNSGFRSNTRARRGGVHRSAVIRPPWRQHFPMPQIHQFSFGATDTRMPPPELRRKTLGRRAEHAAREAVSLGFWFAGSTRSRCGNSRKWAASTQALSEATLSVTSAPRSRGPVPGTPARIGPLKVASDSAFELDAATSGGDCRSEIG